MVIGATEVLVKESNIVIFCSKSCVVNALKVLKNYLKFPLLASLTSALKTLVSMTLN